MLQIINKKIVAPTVTDAPTNHIIVVDCSGSMYGDIDKIRTHLKNKIPTMVKKDDTLTVIWFSGRNQFGVLFEGAEVHGLTDLTQINSTIDRYLTTVGLTGFKQPLEEVLAVINRMRSMQHSMIFMSDGYDNEWSKSDIIKACTDLSDDLVSACFVEYGNYADHDMLLEMAESVGASLVQATEFSKYAFQLDNLKNLSFGKRIQIDVPVTAENFNFVVGHTSDGFVLAKANAGKISLPSNTASYSYITGTGDSFNHIDDDVTACAVVAALVQRGQADIAVDLAAKIGDVSLFKSIENAFSKQDYAKVVEHAKELAVGDKKLFATAPKSDKLAVDPNAYNVLQLLMDLSQTEDNEIVLSHSDFIYNSIGQKRKTVDVNGHTPKFTDATQDETTAQISNLTFDGERPNVSILVKRLGSVSLPDNEFGFGNSFNSFVWRNYTIVRDGIVNVSKLPMKLTRETYSNLVAQGLDLGEYKVGKVFVIDVAAMPVINKSMITGVTAEWLFKTSYAEYELECQQKYVKTLFDKPEVGAKFSALYGEDAALFLKEYGITEGGFSPKTEAGEVTDKYVAKILSVKLAGMSSAPKPADVTAALEKGKALTVSQATMHKAMKLVDAQIQSGKTAEEVFAQIKTELKSLRSDIVKAKFGVIIGRKWFSDLSGYDDTTRELDFGLSKKVKCEVVLSDKLV